MTAIRDRRSDTESAEKDTVAFPWNERSVINSRRGMPWWGSVLLAFGLALTGAFVDQLVTDSLSVLFHACYVVGALGAVLAVQRKSLFGPMVQPPLAMALAVPLVVLTVSGMPEDSDTLAKALAVGKPLIDSFPMMAGTTVATVLVGVLRLVKQRDPDAPSQAGKSKSSKTEPDESGSGRAASDKAKSAKPRSEARPEKARSGKGTATADEASAVDETRPAMDAARPDTPGEARPPRRAPGAPGAQNKSAPPPERTSRPRGGPATPPPRRAQNPDAEQPRTPREEGPPPRRRPAPPPEQAEKRRRGEGRPQPPAGRGRRVPPPPRGEEPPRGRQPGAGPRRDTPRSEPPRGGRPRGDHPPRRGRPWDDDRP